MPEPTTTEPKKETPPAQPAPKHRFRARLRYGRISPRKLRSVVDLIRGKDYNTASAILRACSKRGAFFCKKLLDSAYENAMDKARNADLNIDGNKLHLVEAHVDPGPVIKRWRPSSVRRPTMIKKRMAHMTFVLEERDLREPKKVRAKRKKASGTKKMEPKTQEKK